MRWLIFFAYTVNIGARTRGRKVLPFQWVGGIGVLDMAVLVS